MNILIVTGIFPPDLGGPASYVPRLAQMLVGRGHRVEVVCLSDRSDHNDSAYPFSVHRIRRGTFWPWRVLMTCVRIWRSALGSDLLYVNGLGAESAVAALAALRPAVHKVVGDYAWERAVGRGWFSGTLEEYQSAPKPLRLRALDWVRTLPLHLAKAVIVPSKYLQEIVRGWGVSETKPHVIYNAVESVAGSECRELPAWKGNTVVTVCRLVEWKGVDALIRVVGQLPDTRLIVVGDGPLRDSLEEQVCEGGLNGRVCFVGSVPQEQVRSWIGVGDVFALNSTYEGLPHVVLEAMMAGAPVVATAAGGTIEVVEDNVTGLLVTPGDETGLREALERLLRDSELGRALIAGANAQLAERFDHGNMFLATEKLLCAAVDQKPRATQVELEQQQ